MGDGMQLDNDQTHHTYKLGPVEKLALVGAFALLVSALGYIFHSTTSQLDNEAQAIARQGQQLDSITTQQAVTNAQLLALTQQLADVPGLTRQVAELQVQESRDASDIQQLQKDRR